MRYWQCFVPAVLVVVGVLASSPALASISTIDVPGATGTIPTGINDRGQIVGSYLTGDVTEIQHGFVLDKGTFIPHCQTWEPEVGFWEIGPNTD